MHTITAFAIRHDDEPAFQAAFFVLTFLAAALLNVGAFGVLVAIHVAMDIVKYRHVHHKGWAWTMQATFRESLIDVLLLTTALFLSVYFHESSGLLLMSGFVRFEGVMLAGIAATLARMEVLCHLLYVFSHAHTHIQNVHRGIAGPWKRLEVAALLAIALSIGLVAIAPSVSPNPAVIHHIIVEELVPGRL
jgi:hypothetical protein